MIYSYHTVCQLLGYLIFQIMLSQKITDLKTSWNSKLKSELYFYVHEI